MWLSLPSLVLLFATASAALAQSVAPLIQTAPSPKITLASVQQTPPAKQIKPAQHALPVQPKVADTNQDVLLLFAGESANDKILLTLNNNRPDKVTADLTVYDLSGNPRILPSLELNASESRLLDFSGVLRSLNVMAPLGFIKIHYLGKSMELGSQLTLYPIENRGGLDSARSLKVDFASTERHAVAWTPPGSSATFSITNVATTPIDAALTVNGKAETVHLEANQTAIRTREAVEELTSALVDLDVNFVGPVDALRVFGFVASPHDGTLPIRTYDPKGATSSCSAPLDSSRKTRPTHLSVTFQLYLSSSHRF